MAAAIYGIENNLGKLVTPLRSCFNWAEQEFLDHLPDVYFQVVYESAVPTTGWSLAAFTSETISKHT
jgi:hypothetical protein